MFSSSKNTADTRESKILEILLSLQLVQNVPAQLSLKTWYNLSPRLFWCLVRFRRWQLALAVRTHRCWITLLEELRHSSITQYISHHCPKTHFILWFRAATNNCFHYRFNIADYLQWYMIYKQRKAVNLHIGETENIVICHFWMNKLLESLIDYKK